MALSGHDAARAAAFGGAVALLVAGLVLGYIAVIALRRNEGVFLPTGTVALLCLIGGMWLFRTAYRG